ncbi:hypothetical protein [Polycladidibacter hongkongensis]|uniref:hypothetical protein n=1 Tax=Polycladidibacter hongkongensis TaxID=1647556 RepID=UPI0008335985|nr:hypothetical protein [Pseudovibrio hongkongensis]
MLNSVVVIAVALVLLWVLMRPKLQGSERWQATLTPLASIIGSGFLVSVPILAGELGNWAILGIFVLIVAAYCIGIVIRFNIQYAEPLFAARDARGQHRLIISLEKLSQLLLAFAYFVSIAYYLVLLGNFILKGFGIESDVGAQVIASLLLFVIAGAGVSGGLGSVEKVEKYAVALNLAIIGALLAGLLLYNGTLVFEGEWQLPAETTSFSLHKVQVLLGLLIIVQGFETSRFLGDEYSAPLRISSMRLAQRFSAGIYLVFFALISVLFGYLEADRSIAAVISLVGHVAIILPLMLTLGAVASQFGAAIADSLGSAGLLEDTTERRVDVKHAYILIGVVAIALVWRTDVMRIVTLASQAFALFYLTQCGVALAVLNTQHSIADRRARQVGFAFVGLLCLAVVVLGVPAPA